MILYKIKEPVFSPGAADDKMMLFVETPAGEIRIYHESALGRPDNEWNVMIDGDNVRTTTRVEKVKGYDKAVAIATEEYYDQVQRFLDEVVIK